MIFLPVIQLSSLKLGAEDVQHVPISVLPEECTVGFHTLTLKPTMVCEGDEDWIWANQGLE